MPAPLLLCCCLQPICLLLQLSALGFSRMRLVKLLEHPNIIKVCQCQLLHQLPTYLFNRQLDCVPSLPAHTYTVCPPHSAQHAMQAVPSLTFQAV